MKAARAMLLVLQLLAAAYALSAAQRVRGAHGAFTRPDSREANGSGSGQGFQWHGGEPRPAFLKNSGPGDRMKFFGGRHNDSIPSVGAYRSNLALLLQTREEESEQLQGCIMVAIAPRFFLTRASCVRDQQNVPLAFIETAGKNGNATRQPLEIHNTTLHPDYSVNLAIVEVRDQDNVLRKSIRPFKLNAYAAAYYQHDGALSFVSIDNIFNPSLAMNAQSINKLIRVPVGSCLYNSDPTTTQCFAPAELAARELTFEFGQGMLLHQSQSLVGLPDCEGFCSGGMFYSTTYLAPFRSWIDETTRNGARWIAPAKSTRYVAVPTEKEPTYVSLYTSTRQDAEPVCSGALIAPRFVLTTASCATKHVLSVARMNHGQRKLGSNGHDDTIPVTTISVHPQFGNTTKFSNDLAVVALSGPTIYPPTILSNDDTLNQDADSAVACSKPRRSGVDSSIMCLPPPPTTQATALDLELGMRKLGDGLDLTASSSLGDELVSFDVDSLEVDAPEGDACQPMTVEQWNTNAGDGVFDVPSSGSYYLLGLSTGLTDTTVEVAGLGSANHTETTARMCSQNETVGDDDSATLVVRLATPETMQFIDTASVDHTWRDPHSLPFSIFENKFARMGKKSDGVSSIESFSIAYDGELVFEQPPKDLDLGFVVGLRFERFGQNYCGGSLIAPSYVLTAAHCVGGDRAKFVSVGSHESKGAETELIAVKTASVITHPLYGRRSLYSYDLAILELDAQAYPKPVVLDNSHELDASTYLTLFGYGANSAASTVLSEVLRSVDLPYFPQDKCKAKFPELDESMFCAGGELARDACTGDSGSPLVRVVNGKPRLVGVVSSGRNGCGTPGVPGVYAFVAQAQDFIDSVVAGNKWVAGSKTSSSATSVTSAGSGSGDANAQARAADADGTVLRSYGGNASTSALFDVVHLASGSRGDHRLSHVEMAADTPRGLQAALLEFLVGAYDYISGWRPQVEEHWKVAFYSTGNLQGIMELLEKRRGAPLYQRKNRFARPAWGTDDRALSSGSACAGGH